MAAGSGIDLLTNGDIGFAGWSGGVFHGAPPESALEFLARGSLELATMEGSETEIRFLMAERLCNHLDALVVLSLFDSGKRVFGVAVHPTHGEDIDHLVRCADRAMYEVKQNGGNGIALYDTPMNGNDPQ